MNPSIDETAGDLMLGTAALSMSQLQLALERFQVGRERLELESSAVANEVYAKGCLLEWEVLHLQGEFARAKEAAQRAAGRAADAGRAAGCLIPQALIKFLGTRQAEQRLTAERIAVPLHTAYTEIARQFERGVEYSHLAMSCYMQLVALGIDCGDTNLVIEANNGAQLTLLYGAGDSGQFANLRFWQSREAMVCQQDPDRSEELLSDSIGAGPRNPLAELADLFRRANLQIVKGFPDRADAILDYALPLAERVGCNVWARDARRDRTDLGRLYQA